MKFFFGSKDSIWPTKRSSCALEIKFRFSSTIVGVFVVAWFLAIVFLFSDIVQVLAARPWWEDLIAAMATVAVPILALLELRHSGEANRLRDTANDERRRANELNAEANWLGEENVRLTAALDAERNKQLAQNGSAFGPGELKVKK